MTANLQHSPDQSFESENDIDLGAEIRRLAELSPVKYERVRKDEAKRLGIGRVRELDREVEAARRKDEVSNDLGLYEPEPWPDEVDGHDLLDRIVAAIRRYVVISDHAAEAVALWAIHTHCFDNWQNTPRLHVSAPEKECGKSTLLDVLACLVSKALQTENLSTAVMFRVMAEHRPALLVDEFDTFLPDNEDLRGAINAGHKKGGRHLRCVGDDHKVQGFPTFGPVALAGIGELRGNLSTLASRSVRIALHRRKDDESIVNFSDDRAGHLRELASQIARWTADSEKALRDAEPVMPAGIFNRLADNWRPLLAIADVAGGEWPGRARVAATALSGAAASDTASIRIMLLEDIKALFEREGTNRLASAFICEELAKIDERPWPEFGRKQKPISTTQLANLLRPLEIRSTTVNLGGETRTKGYKLESFENIFERYIPPSQGVTPLPSAESVAFGEKQAVTSDLQVTALNHSKPAESGQGNGVTAGNPPDGPNKLFEANNREPTPEEDATDAEERKAIQEIDGVSGDNSKLTEIPDFLDWS